MKFQPLIFLLIFSCVLKTLASDREDAVERLNHGYRPDYVKSLEAIRRSADAGEFGALFLLATLYSNGVGEPRTPDEKPIHLFRRALETGDSRAIPELERRYRFGTGVEADLLEACAYFFRGGAAQSGMRGSTGRNDPRNETIHYLDKLFTTALLEKDQTAALLQLAEFHRTGTHGKINLPRACAFLTLANSPDRAALASQLTPEQRKQMENDLRWMRL